MKFSDLPIKNIRDVADLDAYLICNTVEHEEENVNNINKSLIHVSNFAHKEAVNAIVEQNTKLVSFVNQMINKCQDLEKQIKELKEQVQNSKTEDTNYMDIAKVNEELNNIKMRLDTSLIE